MTDEFLSGPPSGMTQPGMPWILDGKWSCDCRPYWIFEPKSLLVSWDSLAIRLPKSSAWNDGTPPNRPVWGRKTHQVWANSYFWRPPLNKVGADVLSHTCLIMISSEDIHPWSCFTSKNPLETEILGICWDSEMRWQQPLTPHFLHDSGLTD